ncbi:MAG: hypothetical protein AABX89_00740 [Candidatus Thermoplasmatota archaeon]
MNKLLAAVVVGLAALALLAPTAIGHGAAAAREIDTRILADDDGLIGYGPDSCSAAPVCPLSNGALDLLSLDIREAKNETGAHVLWFRAVYQTDHVGIPAELHLTFTAAGAEHEFEWSSTDLTAFSSTTFAAVAGPTPVGDGHPQAVDGMVLASALGLSPGDVISDLAMESHGESGEDLMPGGWTVQGIPFDPVPNPASELEEHEHYDGTYTLLGPAPLVTAILSDRSAGAARSATLTVTNALAGTAQFTMFDVVPAALATLDLASLALDGAATKSAVLTVAPDAFGTLTVTVRSDLGAYQVLSLDLGAAPIPATPSHNGTAHDHDDADGHHDGEANKASPLPLPFLAIAAAVLLARRRA